MFSIAKIRESLLYLLVPLFIAIALSGGCTRSPEINNSAMWGSPTPGYVATEWYTLDGRAYEVVVYKNGEPNVFKTDTTRGGAIELWSSKELLNLQFQKVTEPNGETAIIDAVSGDSYQERFRYLEEEIEAIKHNYIVLEVDFDGSVSVRTKQVIGQPLSTGPATDGSSYRILENMTGALFIFRWDRWGDEQIVMGNGTIGMLDIIVIHSDNHGKYCTHWCRLLSKQDLQIDPLLLDLTDKTGVIRLSGGGALLAFVGGIWPYGVGPMSGPVYSPLAKKIAYTTFDEGGLPALEPPPMSEQLLGPGVWVAPPGYGKMSTGIAIANVDGTDHVQLTNIGCCPVWSPDGEKIAYIHDDGLYVINGDGTNKTTLLEPEFTSDTLAGFTGPVWSSDSNWIVFMCGDMGWTTYLVSVDGASKIDLGRGWVYPSWSPDGKKMVYACPFECQGICVLNGTGNICVMNADGSDRTEIHAGAVMYDSVIWSADSKRIAFKELVTSPVPLSYDICVMNVDGTNEMRLDNGSPIKDSSWSPNLKHVAYIEVNNTKLWVIDGNGINKKLLNSDETEKLVGWSPDGEKFAYVSNGELWVYNAETGNQKVIAGADDAFSWSPNSKYLLVDTNSNSGVLDVITGRLYTIGFVTSTIAPGSGSLVWFQPLEQP